MPSEPERAQPLPLKFSRRSAVKALGAIAVWPYLSDAAAEAFAAIQTQQAPPKLAFLTAGQYTTLDALSETIIPADDHSPGARAARVAASDHNIVIARLNAAGSAITTYPVHGGPSSPVITHHSIVLQSTQK